MTSVPLHQVFKIEYYPLLAPWFGGLLASNAPSDPLLPASDSYRRLWAQAQLLGGAERLGALRRDALTLALGFGYEPSLFALTRWVGRVFASDLYASWDFGVAAENRNLLTDPDAFAVGEWNRRKLVVQSMDASDLRFEAGTFQLVISLGFPQRFGGPEAAPAILAQMARVCGAGGVVAVASESHSPEELVRVAGNVPGLRLVETPPLEISEASRAFPGDALTATAFLRKDDV